MLVSNLDVQQRFANGTQGRLLYWYPDRLPEKRKCVSASCPDLTARFMKETSMTKTEMLADIDFVDVNARMESINNVPGNPVQFLVTLKRQCTNTQTCIEPCNSKQSTQVQVQLGVVPSYGRMLSFCVFCVSIFSTHTVSKIT